MKAIYIDDVIDYFAAQIGIKFLTFDDHYVTISGHSRFFEKMITAINKKLNC